MNRDVEIGLKGDIDRRVRSISTSKGEVGTASSSLVNLRRALIALNTFRFGEHLKYEGGGFFLATGGNITTIQIRVRIGGVNVHDFSYSPAAPSPGPYIWYAQGIITQSGDIGGVIFLNADTSPFNITRGEVSGSWPGPGANMDLDLDMRIVVSAGTGAAQNETWNVIKIPNGSQ